MERSLFAWFDASFPVNTPFVVASLTTLHKMFLQIVAATAAPAGMHAIATCLQTMVGVLVLIWAHPLAALPNVLCALVGPMVQALVVEMQALAGLFLLGPL